VVQEWKVNIEEFFFAIQRNRGKREGSVLERVTDEMTCLKEKDMRRKKN
jgi:hypothetical protein